jgi:putative sigma-54 modulation protein
MDINIQSIHFDADIKLIDFIKKKLSKLESMNNKVINTEVFLKLDNAVDNSNKITEIKLHLPGKTLFAKEQCKTFEEATDLSVESLRRQLSKLKN